MSKIFRPGKDWWNNARINHGGLISNKWEVYAMGYKIATETLVDKVLSEQTNQDHLIYPIVFLYRHYIELRLKEIIDTGVSFLTWILKFRHIMRSCLFGQMTEQNKLLRSFGQRTQLTT